MPKDEKRQPRRATRQDTGMNKLAERLQFALTLLDAAAREISGGHRNGPCELKSIEFVRKGSGMRQGKRLTEAARAELQCRIRGGETFTPRSRGRGAEGSAGTSQPRSRRQCLIRQRYV